MARSWGSLQRRGFVGLAVAIAAAATWAMPAQAGATPRTDGGDIAPVGHPTVTTLSPRAASPATPASKSLNKPFLSANPAELAKAKLRAAAQAGPAAPAAPHSSSARTASGPGTGLYNGINQPGVSAADEGFCCTPPDSTGSIGPNNYVEFVNTTVRVFDRTLTTVSTIDMATFVAAPAGLNVTDPQMQWDPRSNRWYYVAAAFTTHNNYLVFGWSKTPDPSDLAGGWCRFGASMGNQLPDYPKLGHDDNYVLYGANLYDDSTGNFVFSTAGIWAVPKPAAGVTTCSAAGFTAFASPQNPLHNTDGTSAFTPVPVNTSDASTTGYIVAGHSPLAPKPTDPNGPQTKIMVWHVAKQGGTPHLIADGDLTVGSFDVPASAPQPGGPTVDTLDARLTQAVAHADPDVAGAEAIWTQHTINGPGGRSVLRWYEILPASKTVRQQGTVQSTTDFIWNGSISPSIAGNDAAVFYSRGGTSQLPLAAAQSRISTTPLSTLMSGGEAVLALSNAADADFSCSSPYGPPCRWGDYSGASPDPLHAGVVWGSNQVNGPYVFGNPQWQTENYAVTTFGTPPPPPTPCTAVTFGASPASPQAPGISVSVTGSATGCPNPVYQFWIQPPGGAWTILQAYSSSATATWNTTGQAAGTYLFDVWAKQSGSTANWEAHVSPNPTYKLQTPPPPNTCTAVTFGANPASPQVAGATVTLSGAATGCPSPVYQFWIQPPGGSWSILQAYSASSTASWNTTNLAAGNYLFDVWAKQSGSAATWEAHLASNPTYTLTAPPPPVTCTSVTWNAPSPASPQTPGVPVTLSGTASGCPSPVYQFWMQPPGGSWTLLQAYSPTSSVTWNTTGQPTGTYLFDVWAKQSGSSASWEAHVSPNPTYTLQAAPSCTTVTWSTPSPASPQAPGVTVNLGGTASGCPNPVYQFWIQPPGGSWTILQAYSTASTATWNTIAQPAGTYLFDVWAKQSGSSASWEAHVSPNPTYTLQAAATCSAVTWNAPSPASPQAPGASVTFSGTASGCPNPVYQFWIQPPGGSWSILQAYSSSASVTWSTTGQPVGTYLFDVWAKQSGSTASWEAHVSPNPTYTLQAANVCTGVTMNANPVSPQAAGTPVMISGAATGCSSPVYQFWIKGPGGNWTILQAYSSSASVSWNTTGLAAGTYLFDVWVKQSGSTADWEAHISPNPTYTLT
jgi:hypothetical protein